MVLELSIESKIIYKKDGSKRKGKRIEMKVVGSYTGKCYFYYVGEDFRFRIGVVVLVFFFDFIR